MIDFTDYPIDITADFGGSDQKRGIIYNNEKYMLKFSDKIGDDKRNELNSSYSNSVLSEKLCCDILKALGFEVQETKLGYIRRENKENKPVVACKIFSKPNCKMVSFKAITEAILDEKPGKIPKIDEIYKIFLKPNAYFKTVQDCETALAIYWDRFILDALLGNFDRHANNWSYFVNNETGDISATPIYDCGSCLYPQVSDEGAIKILSSQLEINKRIEVFPKAALLDENNEKIIYKNFIGSLKNKDCNEALLRVIPKIDFKVIDEIIDNLECSNIRKSFYRIMLKERYNQILLPAYEQLKNNEFIKYNDYDNEIDDLDEI